MQSGGFFICRRLFEIRKGDRFYEHIGNCFNRRGCSRCGLCALRPPHCKKWGIDPKAETPAVKYNDGKDYVPTNGWTVFSHQFSSIAGAGPVTGAIQAAVFGWLPVLLWILIGGVFFGAVTDFGALYASVKNQGKSMGMLIEKYIGKLGRKLFTIFCWLFSLLIIAVFADMVSGTFNAFDATTGAKLATAGTNGSAGMVSIMFMLFAVIFGLIQKKFNFPAGKNFLSVLFSL